LNKEQYKSKVGESYLYRKINGDHFILPQIIPIFIGPWLIIDFSLLVQSLWGNCSFLDHSFIKNR